MENRETFKAFLSHRYKSPEINLYFFKLFNEVAEVQFEVDQGTFSTNVTRLERMVRDSDAFIGIYPFPGTDDEARNPEELQKQSRYFRLEVDIAIRSQKPCIFFYDRRYGDLLKPPAGVFFYSYDYREITGTGGFPSYNKHKKLFTEFCEVVESSKNYNDIQLINEKSTVGLIIPENEKNLSRESLDQIKNVLSGNNYSDIEIISWPFSLDSKLFRLLDKLDFAIVELSGQVASSGIPAYLHGKFIPMIRLKFSDTPEDSDLMKFLYQGVEVGYSKDTIVWNDAEVLARELEQKLGIINSGVTRVNTFDDAQKYFMSAALRKETVFLSYSGLDIDTAVAISNSLKRHFQKVFDYRDGESIRPGQPWLTEIFNQLSASAIGINLLSEGYLNSGNCQHEAREMVANFDSGNLKLFPIKLFDDKISLPPYLRDIQYFRRNDYKSTDELIKTIISLL